jgi:hypothetical protein
LRCILGNIAIQISADDNFFTAKGYINFFLFHRLFRRFGRCTFRRWLCRYGYRRLSALRECQRWRNKCGR